MYVHSVADFSNKRLKVSLPQMDFNFLCVYICSMIYSTVSLLGMFVNHNKHPLNHLVMVVNLKAYLEIAEYERWNIRFGIMVLSSWK